MNVKLESGEKIEPLGKQRSIIVSKEHTFGTDAVLLSYFADGSVRPCYNESAVQARRNRN